VQQAGVRNYQSTAGAEAGIPQELRMMAASMHSTQSLAHTSSSGSFEDFKTGFVV
jgi:hypothetical protein